MDTVRSRQKRWLGHILRHDSSLRITLEGQIQEKNVYGRPRTMFLDWLLKTEEGNISYEELKMFPRTDWDGVNEDGNLPYGRALQRETVESLSLCNQMEFLSVPDKKDLFLAMLLLAASRAYTIGHWCLSLRMDVCHQSFFQIATPLAVFSDFCETWHTCSMCQRRKNCVTDFQNFVFENLWQIFKISIKLGLSRWNTCFAVLLSITFSVSVMTFSTWDVYVLCAAWLTMQKMRRVQLRCAESEYFKVVCPTAKRQRVASGLSAKYLIRFSPDMKKVVCYYIIM